MNRRMTKEESFAQRRKLFKEVWATAMDGDDNHNGRHKVIKTLNLDDIERSTGKRKKQKLKNLRTVCHKLLEYCDRQEANSPSRSPESKNRQQNGATYSGDDNTKTKPKKRSKSTSLKLPKSTAKLNN